MPSSLGAALTRLRPTPRHKREVSTTAAKNGSIADSMPLSSQDNSRQRLSVASSSLLSLPLTDSQESHDSQESPDATTISTASEASLSLSLPGPGSSKVKTKDRSRASMASPSGEAMDEAHAAFVELQHELHRFVSRHGVARANVLRLGLLPFLREQRYFFLPGQSALIFRTGILALWWSKLLAAVIHAAGSDRAAYYEAISGLLDRPEWLGAQQKLVSLLKATTLHILDRAGQHPTLPVALGAFLGKVLAYGFFYIPDLAAYLLTRLDDPLDATVARVVAQLRRNNINHSPLSEAYALQAIPEASQPLIGLIKPLAHAQPRPDCVPSVSAGWERHWNVDSGIFASFLKHYFGVMARLLPPPPPQSDTDDDDLDITHMAPGIVLILTAIMQFLDRLVRQNNRSFTGSRSSTGNFSNAGVSNSANTIGGVNSGVGANITTASPTEPTGPIRIDQLRLFSTLREILHNDPSCVPYYAYFGIMFDRMFQAVATGITVYHMDACVTLCDCVEEWLSSLNLNHHAASQLQVETTRHLAVDYEFWLQVAQRMLRSNNSHTEVRALAFLGNIWPLFPPDHARVACKWILSPQVWQQLFYHWSPLVRSYYHRLLCYRIAALDSSDIVPGVSKPTLASSPVPEWLCVTEVGTKVATDARALLAARLIATYHECTAVATITRMPPSTAPSLPLPRCCLAILPNAAAQSPSDLLRVYPFDIFDNAAYWTAPDVPKKPNPDLGTRQLSQVVPKPVQKATESESESESELDRFSDRVSPPAPNERATQDPIRNQTSENTFEDGAAPPSPPLIGGEASEEITSRSSFDSERSEGSIASVKSTSSASTMMRKWWNKLVVSDSISDKTSTPSSLPPKIVHQNSPHVKKFKTSAPRIPPPLPLVQRRPEIRRPSHRFVLLPTKFQPPENSRLVKPRMPNAIVTSTPKLEALGKETTNPQSSLAMWNYGGKSLAEWNVTVELCEQYLSVHRCGMPFIVAEIHWKTVVQSQFD